MKKEKVIYDEYIENGKRFMECKVCGQFTEVSHDTKSTICCICVREGFEKEFPFQFKTGYKPTGRPRGWKFMKEYVDKDGTVFHKGVEQPKLKGKLKPTVIKKKDPVKRLTKREKDKIKHDALVEINKLKKKMAKLKFKKDKRAIQVQINKLLKVVK